MAAKVLTQLRIGRPKEILADIAQEVEVADKIGYAGKDL